MGALYQALPNSSHVVVEVATSAALKTVLQVATPSTTNIRVVAWGISFDGTSTTAAPGICTLIDVNVAATVTSLTPALWGSGNNQASLCVGGTSATGYNASGEGTITASKIIDAQNLHPQGGYAVWFPENRRPIVAASRFLRIRTTFAATVNCIPYILWEEPAA